MTDIVLENKAHRYEKPMDVLWVRASRERFRANTLSCVFSLRNFYGREISFVPQPDAALSVGVQRGISMPCYSTKDSSKVLLVYIIACDESELLNNDFIILTMDVYRT